MAELDHFSTTRMLAVAFGHLRSELLAAQSCDVSKHHHRATNHKCTNHTSVEILHSQAYAHFLLNLSQKCIDGLLTLVALTTEEVVLTGVYAVSLLTQNDASFASQRRVTAAIYMYRHKEHSFDLSSSEASKAHAVIDCLHTGRRSRLIEKNVSRWLA